MYVYCIGAFIQIILLFYKMYVGVQEYNDCVEPHVSRVKENFNLDWRNKKFGCAKGHAKGLWAMHAKGHAKGQLHDMVTGASNWMKLGQ